jgi:hypothetical protein
MYFSAKYILCEECGHNVASPHFHQECIPGRTAFSAKMRYCRRKRRTMMMKTTRLPVQGVEKRRRKMRRRSSSSIFVLQDKA